MASIALKTFFDGSINRQLFKLAIPMVLSNITIPLLGLVDATVIGHLEHAWYLGGVALGSTIISVIFWLFGFLRMSTTGLAAQVKGIKESESLALIFIQGLLMAMVVAVLFLLFHQLLGQTIFMLSDASSEVKHYGTEYFLVRAWSAPAVLINFVVFGWLLGTQNSKPLMWIVIAVNVLNIILDFIFVVQFDFKVEGAAAASVISDYMGSILGLLFVNYYWKAYQLPSFSSLLMKCTHNIMLMVQLNRDIFLRSLCLQAVFSFITFQGALFSDQIVAANAILMSFLMIVSYGIDGFAYAVEAMIGKAIGNENKAQIKSIIKGGFFWGGFVSLILSVVFIFFGTSLIDIITDIESVRKEAKLYLSWFIFMPVAAMGCYLFDGIFIGATKGKEMRNSMFVAMLGFFVLFYSFSNLENHALWLALLGFMLMRGLGLGFIFIRQWKRNQFILS